MQSVTDGVYQRHVICLPVREYLLFLLSVCVVSFYIFFLRYVHVLRMRRSCAHCTGSPLFSDVMFSFFQRLCRRACIEIRSVGSICQIDQLESAPCFAYHLHLTRFDSKLNGPFCKTCSCCIRAVSTDSESCTCLIIVFIHQQAEVYNSLKFLFLEKWKSKDIWNRPNRHREAKNLWEPQRFAPRLCSCPKSKFWKNFVM